MLRRGWGWWAGCQGGGENASPVAVSPAYNRLLRTTPKTGLLTIDRTAINADAKLDGKFGLRTSDATLTAEDVALGYKQLLQVEWVARPKALPRPTTGVPPP